MPPLDPTIKPDILDPHNLNTSKLISLLKHCDLLNLNSANNSAETIPFKPDFEFEKPRWLQLYNVFFNVILVGIVLLSGVTGNILSCLVLIRDRTHGTTNLILTSLAICDTAFLINCLLFQFLQTLADFTLWLNYMNVYANIIPFIYGAGQTVRMMRNWLVVVVTVERWVAVCKPLHAPRICTRSTARWTIGILTIICAFYNIPNYFLVEARLIYCHGGSSQLYTNKTVTKSISDLTEGISLYYSVMRPSVRNNYSFKLVYRIISYTLIVIVIPTLIIGVLNTLLIRGIKYANARRAHMMARIDYANRQQNQHVKQQRRHYTKTSANSKELPSEDCSKQPSAKEKPRACFVRSDRTTRSRTGEVNRLCIGVIIIYLVCELPAVGYQIIHMLEIRKAIDLIKPVTNFLVCLNSGVNFFVYVFLGRRFRSQLKDLLKRTCCRCFGPYLSDMDARSIHEANSWRIRVKAQPSNSENIHMKPVSNRRSADQNCESLNGNNRVQDDICTSLLHPPQSEELKLPCGKCLQRGGKSRKRLPNEIECCQTITSFVDS